MSTSNASFVTFQLVVPAAVVSVAVLLQVFSAGLVLWFPVLHASISVRAVS